MPYEFFPITFFLILVLGSWGLTLVGRSLRDKKMLREREMIHQERMQAMQSGIEVAQQSPTPVPSTSNPAAHARWFRMVSLGLGLFMLFVGIGMCIAFSIAEDFEPLWPIGIIPALAGVGFLLFYRLSARLEENLTATERRA